MDWGDEPGIVAETQLDSIGLKRRGDIIHRIGNFLLQPRDGTARQVHHTQGQEAEKACQAHNDNMRVSDEVETTECGICTAQETNDKRNPCASPQNRSKEEVPTMVAPR